MVYMATDDRDNTTNFFDMMSQHTEHLFAEFQFFEVCLAILLSRKRRVTKLARAIGALHVLKRNYRAFGPTLFILSFPSPSGWARKTNGPLARHMVETSIEQYLPRDNIMSYSTQL